MTAMEIKQARYFLNLMRMETNLLVHHTILKLALFAALKESMMMTETKLSLLNITKKGKLSLAQPMNMMRPGIV